MRTHLFFPSPPTETPFWSTSSRGKVCASLTTNKGTGRCWGGSAGSSAEGVRSFGIDGHWSSLLACDRVNKIIWPKCLEQGLETQKLPIWRREEASHYNDKRQGWQHWRLNALSGEKGYKCGHTHTHTKVTQKIKERKCECMKFPHLPHISSPLNRLSDFKGSKKLVTGCNFRGK